MNIYGAFFYPALKTLFNRFKSFLFFGILFDIRQLTYEIYPSAIISQDFTVKAAAFELNTSCFHLPLPYSQTASLHVNTM